MTTIKLGCMPPASGRSRFQAIIQSGLFCLVPGVSNAQTFDPIPVPYCNIAYDHSYSYTGIEAGVTVANPEGKALAQFVLEAFAKPMPTSFTRLAKPKYCPHRAQPAPINVGALEP